MHHGNTKVGGGGKTNKTVLSSQHNPLKRNNKRDPQTELVKRDEPDYLNILDSSDQQIDMGVNEENSNSLQISEEILPLNNPPSQGNKRSIKPQQQQAKAQTKATDKLKEVIEQLIAGNDNKKMANITEKQKNVLIQELTKHLKNVKATKATKKANPTKRQAMTTTGCSQKNTKQRGDRLVDLNMMGGIPGLDNENEKEILMSNQPSEKMQSDAEMEEKQQQI